MKLSISQKCLINPIKLSLTISNEMMALIVHKRRVVNDLSVNFGRDSSHNQNCILLIIHEYFHRSPKHHPEEPFNKLLKSITRNHLVFYKILPRSSNSVGVHFQPFIGIFSSNIYIE